MKTVSRPIVAVFLTVLISLPILAQSEEGKITIHRLVKHDVSPPLRDIPPAPRPSGVKRIHPVKPIPRPYVPGHLDNALQTSALPSLNAPTVTTQFNGIGSNNGYTVQSAPPDTNGDVSSLYYVQTVNTDFAVFNKSTGAYVYGPVTINTLWSGFGGGCQTNNDGDPTVTYDQIADRWIITQFSVSSTPYLECIAISTSNNPTGSWYRYSYSFGTSFNDYPKVGVMVDSSNASGGAYYITYNMFNSAGTSFLGGNICAYNRGAMLTGAAASSSPCYNVGTSYGGLLAADLDGSTLAPSGSPEFVVGMGNDNASLVYWAVTPNFSTSTLSHTGPTTLAVASFTPACNGGTCIPQSGTTQQLDSLADRLMNRLQYRNFSGSPKMVVSHSVGSISGARWYQLAVSGSTLSVTQQGTFSPDSTYRWMPSVAMDGSGDIAMGYSTSSSSLHPGIAYTGRIPSDAVNTMQAETVAYTGAGSQTGSSLSRWGDYANMSVDPADDCTYWYTTEYIPSNGAFNWATRIVSFKFSSCGGGGGDTTPPTTSITAPAAGSTLSGTVTVSANASDNVGVTNVEFYAGTTLIGSDSTSPYSISWNTTTVANGGYNLTSKAYDAAGNTGTSSAVAVTVSNAGQAAYDATLKAPKCGTVGTFCDSGTLLNGRATLGPEPNYPNTINNSCSDGTSGTYHSDESNDKIKVSTTDGSTFAAGKTVKVEATVWCWGTADQLDLYYAANASSPSWTLIGTQACTLSGQSAVLSANYTLPSGSLQAVRANFRYNGSTSSCSTGSYDDHDDLIFAVGAGTPDTTPPTTSITAPANGATVSGTITVSANASDNVGVTKVDFYVDGSTLIGSDTTSPYSISWNTTTVVNGSHTLTSKAYDAAGNIGTSTAVSVTVNNSVSCGSSSQLLSNPGFESGATIWTQTSGVITSSTSRPARTGSWKAWLNGYGTTHTDYIYQQITIPSNACSAQLSFWIRIDTAETTTTTAYDKLQVQILNSSGTVLATLATYSNLNKNTTYTQKTFDLAAYKGQTIRVRFYGTEDSSLQTSFVIDDTAVNITQ